MNVQVNSLQIRKYQAPQTHRVVALDREDEPEGYYQECLFRIQGIAYERELPPLKSTRHVTHPF